MSRSAPENSHTLPASKQRNGYRTTGKGTAVFPQNLRSDWIRFSLLCICDDASCRGWGGHAEKTRKISVKQSRESRVVFSQTKLSPPRTIKILVRRESDAAAVGGKISLASFSKSKGLKASIPFSLQLPQSLPFPSLFFRPALKGQS